jgi:hypothetical protein
MRSVALLLALSAAACVPNDPEVSTQTSNLTGTNTTTMWVPGKDDGTAIWPAEQGIKSVQVLMRSGPDRLEHRVQTFLAFVVWNQSVVGKIYRVDVGAAGADFRAKLSNIQATRTSSLPDTSASASGTALGGPAPPPHPNVDGNLVFNDPYLGAVRTYAGQIDDATSKFLATPEQ